MSTHSEIVQDPWTGTESSPSPYHGLEDIHHGESVPCPSSRPLWEQQKQGAGQLSLISDLEGRPHAVAGVGHDLTLSRGNCFPSQQKGSTNFGGSPGPQATSPGGGRGGSLQTFTGACMPTGSHHSSLPTPPTSIFPIECPCLSFPSISTHLSGSFCSKKFAPTHAYTRHRCLFRPWFPPLLL